MASPLAKLYELLSGGSAEQRIAAAIVLGEVEPKDTKAVRLLAEAVGSDDPSLSRYAVEALGKIGSPAARKVLYPLLDRDEPDLRDVVAHAAARTGNPAVAHINRVFAEAPLGRKRTYLRVLAALRTKEAMSLLLTILTEPTMSIVREAVSIFREETGALESKDAKALSGQVRQAIVLKSFERNRAAVDAAIQILNHLRDPASVPILLKFADAEHPAGLRRSALQGLRWVLPDHRSREAAIDSLLSYLDEDDFQNIVSPALEALQPLELPASSAKRLIELSESRHPLVRKFAIGKMSAFEQPDVVRMLVSALSDADPMIRELASRSLRELPGAWKIVAESLENTTNVDLAWRMVHAVNTDGAMVEPEALEKVAKDALTRLESSDPLAEPALSLLQTLNPKVHYESLLKRAMHWKRKREFAQAELCLRPLTGNEACTDDVRFELAVMSLKNSTPTSGAIARDSDLSLSLVKGLVKNAEFPLMKRLTGESKILEPGDYYYLGFHLVEGSPDERELGTAILRRIVEKGARSKVGRSAKSKLRIEGLL